jgi:hypothetical protein
MQYRCFHLLACTIFFYHICSLLSALSAHSISWKQRLDSSRPNLGGIFLGQDGIPKDSNSSVGGIRQM